MKSFIIKTGFFIPLLLMMGTGCEKESLETYSTKKIIGKWEIIELGNWPYMRPLPRRSGYYTEYLPDSIVRVFEYDKNQFTLQAKYWINDSLLYTIYTRDDGHRVTTKNKYQFYDKYRKLRIDFEFAEYNTEIYKRIN